MPSSIQSDRKTLVIVERDEREVAAVTFELLQVGRDVAAQVGGMLCSAVLGFQTELIAANIAGFSDEVYCIDSPLLATFRSDLYLHFLEKLCGQISPEIILIAHTLNTIDWAPRLAYRMGATLVTDCTSIRIDRDTRSLLCTKPVYGDRASAVFMSDSWPKMATLRPKSMERMSERTGGEGTIVNVDISLDQTTSAFELIGTAPGEAVSLDKADAIVAGGRGVKGREGLELLGSLIDTLKNYFSTVELGASRPLVDGGLLPKSRQLGQTGEKAAPNLYFAVAISGSSQHVSGISGSKKIVAINKDGEAPIFGVADYGVVGAYETVVPAFVVKLRELS